LTAHWVPEGNDRHAGKKLVIEGYRFFLPIDPAIERQTYTEQDFSAFLPEKLPAVGQIWSVEPESVAKLLRQFHPFASMHLNADGRRVGPDGAFAVLQAVSPSYLDIALRVHAEFDVTDELRKSVDPRYFLLKQGWYTPAYFSGRMIVNRDKGTVEYFRLGLPADRTLNAHLTMSPADSEPVSHYMARVERMELLGGNSEVAAKVKDWQEAIARAEADRRLEHVFYKFMDIAWVPFERTLAAARDKKKPILAVVLWGNLDDQSC